MIVRSLDVNGDMNFGKGKSDYFSNRNALAQIIATRLRSHLGDCFFAEQDGIDWFNLIGSKRMVDLKLAVTSIILETEGVQSLADLTFSLNEDRQLTIRYNLISVYGDIESTFVFEG